MALHAFVGRGKKVLPAVLLAGWVAAAVLGATSGQTAVSSDETRRSGGADFLEIRISGSEDTGRMPPAVFFHDRHTRALTDKDCSACHEAKSGEDKAYTFVFKDANELSGQEAMERYHEACIGCHKEQRAKSGDFGPLVDNCRGCHRQRPDPALERELIGFDRSLHYRHEEADSITYRPGRDDQNCGACHHVYDEQAEELVYKEGEEGSCRYCHKQEKVEDTRSFQTAAHDDCVNCHQGFAATQTKAGPVECRGCHNAEAISEIEKVSDIPRLKRGQPDAVLMANWLVAAQLSDEMPARRTHAVVFDHLRHESASDTCRQCHHESLESCSECHQAGGLEEGDFVSLERSMHRPGSDRSCIGCHMTRTAAGDCSGCHALMPEKSFVRHDCESCHEVDPRRLQPLPVDETRLEKIALSSAKKRPKQIKRVAAEDIPEIVTIDSMVDQYQAAKMPHRKIVTTLAENIGDNRLAAVFHDSETTLCAGCHHNSPARLNPPACASCHGKRDFHGTEARPALMGAYHGQCIGCHTQMGMEKPAATDCTACHEKQENPGAKPSRNMVSTP